MALAHTLTRASRRNRWVPSLLKGLSRRSSRGGGPESLARSLLKKTAVPVVFAGFAFDELG
jgi:hypothetical protein